MIQKAGFAFALSLPAVTFNRGIGEFSQVHTDTAGKLLFDDEWEPVRDATLPNEDDAAFVVSLMQPESRPGKFAGWIAPAKVGIDNKPGEFEYVQVHE